MDLSLVTDPLWRRFYQREFGQEHTSKVIARLKELGQKTPYTWRELFAVKSCSLLHLLFMICSLTGCWGFYVCNKLSSPYVDLVPETFVGEKRETEGS
jgi:hypothetical protein